MNLIKIPPPAPIEDEGSEDYDRSKKTSMIYQEFKMMLKKQRQA